jgi:LacI family transcriptional regulator
MPKQSNKAERRRVALIVESSMTVGRQIIRGIAEYVRQASHWSVYYEPSHIQKKTLPAWFETWQGNGVIARIWSWRFARQFAKKKLPVVDLVGDILDTGIPLVQVDNRAIATIAANHLLEHDFSTFAFCGVRGPLWSKQRCDYFVESLRSSGHACRIYQLPSSYSKAWFAERERDRLAQWLAGLPKPIGIMAASDWMGQQILEACRRIEALVPEEVAVVGVDDDKAICEISDPMLSSINPRHDRVGFYAAELLDALMRGEPPPREPLTVGVPNLVIRRSTDIQTIADRDVAAAVRFIRENACHDICVADVAASIALSPSTVKRRFRSVLDRSVHDEIVRVRLERTRELLAETEMTLAQIASAAGFRHQEYLGVVFKAESGMTPGQFREQTKSKVL